MRSKPGVTVAAVGVICLLTSSVAGCASAPSGAVAGEPPEVWLDALDEMDRCRVIRDHRGRPVIDPDTGNPKPGPCFVTEEWIREEYMSYAEEVRGQLEALE